MSYIDTIKERARLDRKTIVLPESNDKRTLLAAAKIMEEGIANIIMIGNEEKIMDGAGWLEVDLSGVKVVNPATTDKLDEYVNLLYETRKAKGMTPEKAREKRSASRQEGGQSPDRRILVRRRPVGGDGGAAMGPALWAALYWAAGRVFRAAGRSAGGFGRLSGVLFFLRFHTI